MDSKGLWGWSTGWAVQAQESGQSLSQGPPGVQEEEGRAWDQRAAGRAVPVAGTPSRHHREHKSHMGHFLRASQSCYPVPAQSRHACPLAGPGAAQRPSRRLSGDTFPLEASPESPWAPRTSPQARNWPFPAGVTGRPASWGDWAGGGQPSSHLFRAGHLLGGRLGWRAPSGWVGSVRLRRSSARPVWSGPGWHWALRAGVPGGQGGQRVLIVGSYL